MYRLLDTNYLVTGAVSVNKRDRPASTVPLQVLSFLLVNAICKYA